MHSPRLALGAALVVLPACGYPSYYPNTSRYEGVFDTDARDDCANATLEAVDLTVLSHVESNLDLYVIADDCSEAYLTTLGPGVPYTVPTTAGTVFEVTLGGGYYGSLSVPSGAATYTWEVL